MAGVLIARRQKPGDSQPMKTPTQNFIIVFTSIVACGSKQAVAKAFWRGTENGGEMKETACWREDAKQYKTRSGAEKTAKMIRETYSWEPDQVGVEIA
jgi:hypothetical protein